MTVIRDVKLNIEKEQVNLRLGRVGVRPVPHMLKLVDELLKMLPELMEPAFVYEVTKANGNHGKGTTASVTVPVGLQSATRLAFAVSTIGPGVEEQVSKYFAQKDALRALMLDHIGSIAARSLQQQAFEFIRNKEVLPGDKATNPLKPGGLCWHISAQRRIFELVSPQQIGVSLSSGAVMFPRKSGSMAIGIGPEAVAATPETICARCNLKEGCNFMGRKPGSAGSETKKTQ